MSAGGIFRYTMTDELGSETTLGTFMVDGERVFFNVESGPGAGLPLRMRIDARGLSATGSTFVRERLVADAPIRVETPAPTPTRSEVEGTWTLRSSGGESTSTRFTFTRAGAFRYEGVGGSSAGNYRLTDDGIELIYTEIDGEPVEAGSHFHKTLPFLDGRSAFQVDTYRYERASR